MSDEKPPRKSWNIKIPTDGGPVSYLNIFDRQAEIRIPEEMRMGTDGVYRYRAAIYRWTSGSSW